MRQRFCGAIAIALAFGVVVSVMKGSDGGVRDAAGNVSAPWLILPLVAGALVAARRPLLGAVVGLLTTAASLLGFYLANAFVLDLGPHSTLHDLGLTLSAAGGLWFRAGLISGPVAGGVGALAAGRDRPWLGAMVAGLLLFEPVAWLLWFGVHHQSVSAAAVSPALWVLEAGLGVACAVAVWRRQRVRLSS
jgi:hypothetical protein